MLESCVRCWTVVEWWHEVEEFKLDKVEMRVKGRMTYRKCYMVPETGSLGRDGYPRYKIIHSWIFLFHLVRRHLVNC